MTKDAQPSAADDETGNAPLVCRRLMPWRLLGLGLAVVGGGLYITGASLTTARAVVVGTNAGVNEGAGDLADIASHNSPGIVRNPVRPVNLVVANRVDTPRFSCALHVSRDGGATWVDTDLPFPAGEEAPPRCYVPDPAFGADGILYVSFATLTGPGNRPNAAWVVSSHDGGRSFSDPYKALGPLAFQTRLVADRTEPGRLFLSWLQATETANLGFASAGNPIQVAHSDDGGRTWSAPVRVSSKSRERVVAPSPAAGSDGQLLIAYLDLGDDRLDYSGAHGGRGGEPYPGRWQLVVARSTDEGSTWRETVVDDALVPAERIIVFLPPSPSVAVHHEGRVHVSFSDARLGDPDVWLWTSSDGGASFGPARRVNDTRRSDGTAQYRPAVAVAPNGRVDVAYYDRRADDRDLFNHVSLQSSFDHGDRFGPRVRLSAAPSDSRIGWGSERQLPDLGSRLALVSADDAAVAVWADTRAGTLASGKQDLARAIVAVSGPSPLRAPLRLAAVAALAAGLGVLAADQRRRWRSRRSG